MIGNDIVDRAQAKRDSNWQRRGFLDKLFTSSEQQLIQEASDPECMVWTLWSMKESAYKATSRKTGKRVFSPTKISCTLKTWSDEAAEGFVVYEQEYRTKSSITSEYVTSVAFPAHKLLIPEPVIIPLERDDHRYQSARLRASILEYCTAVLPGREEELQVANDKMGLPVLIVKNSWQENIGVPISLSHHGHYGAFCVAHFDCTLQD